MRVGHAETQDEGEDERRHHVHQRRHADREVGGGRFGCAAGFGELRAGEQARKQLRAREIGAEARDEGEDPRQRRGEGEQTAGASAQIGYARSDEPQNQQRDDEAEEVAEDGIEGQHDAREPVGEKEAAADARRDGEDDAGQQSEFEFHRSVGL